MMFGSSAPNLKDTSEQDAALLSSIQAASQHWQSFQWKSKLEAFEATLQGSKEARELSVAARKDLAETTKQFKRAVKTVEQAKQGLASGNTPETASATVAAIDGMSRECRVIVKAYQGEIDNLTRRCKNAESAHGSLCQALTEMPDPSAVLSTVLEQMLKQQKEIDHLKKINEEVTKEAQKVQKDMAQMKKSSKNDHSGLTRQEKEELIQLRADVTQYEIETKNLRDQSVTVRKLEAKIAEMQGAAELDMQEKLEKARQELAETEGRRAVEALEREAAMERRVEHLELQLKAERAGREAVQSHLLDADEGAGEREAAWEAQRRILVDDAERLRQSMHQITQERNELSLQLAAISGKEYTFGKTPPPSGGVSMADFMLERKAYEAEVAELSNTASSLREELKLKDEALLEARASLEAKLESLEQENASLKTSVASLGEQLAAAPSVSLLNSMKRELRILKRLEYNADDVDAAEDPEMTGAGSLEMDERDLESVLVEKLRRAESGLVDERNSRLAQAKECDRLKLEMETSKKAREEAERLVQSLERDLERTIASQASDSAPSISRRSIHLVTPEEQASALNSILDHKAPNPSSAAKAIPSASSVGGEKADDVHSVATIVMAQRDRLRARCDALEAERDSFKRELQIQVQSSESLKADNTKLYEKVRYLQSFGSNNTGNRGGGGFNKRGGVNDLDLDLEALEERYEASVDPFRQFSRIERQRKLKDMPPMERVVFVVAKTVLGTKTMRTALFVYLTCLHLLVFITTAHWSASEGSSTSEHEHLAHLPPVVQVAAKSLKSGA